MLRVFCLSLAVAAFLVPFKADAASAFRFEDVKTLDEMSDLIRARFSLTSPRELLRRVFVDEGGATLVVHPMHGHIEKYIYDINLCSYYIWRWNISVDYTAEGKAGQAFVNGNPVFADGLPKKDVSKSAGAGEKASIYRLTRARPGAHKGEKSLAYMMLDTDSDARTIDDRAVIGAGPSRADPLRLGKPTVYTDVDPWRSIFDSDAAAHIAAYDGDCVAVDRAMQRKKAKAP